MKKPRVLILLFVALAAEGYLVTPITTLELIASFDISGTIKAVIATRLVKRTL